MPLPSSPPPGLPDAKNRRKEGSSGEDYAIQYLLDKGYTLVHRNWRCKVGELDAIVRDPKGITAFVEVKWAKSDRFGTPESWVHVKKQRQIYRVAQAYMQRNNIRQLHCRFDVVTLTGTGANMRIRHIPNAFIGR